MTGHCLKYLVKECKFLKGVNFLPQGHGLSESIRGNSTSATRAASLVHAKNPKNKHINKDDHPVIHLDSPIGFRFWGDILG